MQFTKNDLDMIMQLLSYAVLLATITGFFLSAILQSLFNTVVRKFNRPAVIKTSSGRLYRSISGVYVEKHLLQQTNIQFIHSNKKRSISNMKKRIEILENDLAS